MEGLADAVRPLHEGSAWCCFAGWGHRALSPETRAFQTPRGTPRWRPGIVEEYNQEMDDGRGRFRVRYTDQLDADADPDVVWEPETRRQNGHLSTCAGDGGRRISRGIGMELVHRHSWTPQ